MLFNMVAEAPIYEFFFTNTFPQIVVFGKDLHYPLLLSHDLLMI